MDVNRDIQVQLARINGYDLLGIFVWERMPDGRIGYLKKNGEWFIQDQYAQLEPALEIPRMNEETFLKNLRDSIDRWFLDKDALIANERMESIKTEKKYLIKSLHLCEKALKRAEKTTDWFMKYIESR